MTTPTNDRQTSERERLAKWLDSVSLDHCARDLELAAAQLRADEAEIAQLNRLVELRSNEAVDNLDEAIRLRDELAALRAENEALRTVTDEEVQIARDAFVGYENLHGYASSEAMLTALQSFIRSKEARRE